ncbi:hypothetical protein [Nonomuraea dietziae]|uniref:hypothetical protein n=1 Tax=Nonomuraea dietziae TaxID=65515 RepID=UPI0031E25C56
MSGQREQAATRAGGRDDGAQRGQRPEGREGGSTGARGTRRTPDGGVRHAGGGA